MSIGPVVTALEVRKAMQDSLAKWMPSVLRELAQRHGIVHEAAREPRTWTRMADFHRLSADQSPSVIVTSPGIVAPPERDGEGYYLATWAVSVYAHILGASFEETADLVGLYTAAIRIAGIQHSLAIEGSRRPRWLLEQYAEISNEDSRVVGAGHVQFTVAVSDAAQDNAGPVSEPPRPPRYVDPDDPVVDTATVVLGPK